MSNWSEILTEVNQSFPTNIDLLNKYPDTKSAIILLGGVILCYYQFMKIC